MSTSAWRTFVAIRPRGARSGDTGHPLRAAPRSRPCSAAGRLLAPARLIEDDDVVKTLSAYRAHEPLNIGILPRRPGCREDFLNAEALNTTAEVVTVNTVAVAHHVLGRRVLGECLNDLLGGPVRAGVAGDVLEEVRCHDVRVLLHGTGLIVEHASGLQKSRAERVATNAIEARGNPG